MSENSNEKLNYHDLEVWELAMKLVHLVYKISNDFPKDEKFGLTSQIKRAANSVPLNITEGTGRKTKKDFANFIRNAIAPDLETLNCSEIALQEGFIQKEKHKQLKELAEKIYFKLIKLEKSILDE